MDCSFTFKAVPQSEHSNLTGIPYLLVIAGNDGRGFGPKKSMQVPLGR
jgi:hypothetical protein